MAATADGWLPYPPSPETYARERATLGPAVRARTVTVSGDREALRRLRTLFRRPRSADRQVASQSDG